MVREVICEIKRSIYLQFTPPSRTALPIRPTASKSLSFSTFCVSNDNQQLEIRERFNKLGDLEKKKGADTAKLILNVLEENEFNIKNCRGQGYDNGAYIAGIYKGAQGLIRQNNTQQLRKKVYNLNLCGVY